MWDELCRCDDADARPVKGSMRLRAHMMRVASGPEAFLALRDHFTRSMATLNVASYILGVGDRHPENFLLSSHMEIVGIDFGAGFGHGTLCLPYPELFPIRLTPNVLQVVAPLDGRTVFQACVAPRRVWVPECPRARRPPPPPPPSPVCRRVQVHGARDGCPARRP